MDNPYHAESMLPENGQKLSFKNEKANDIVNEKTTPMFESNQSNRYLQSLC
jgi:hypothetical protein